MTACCDRCGAGAKWVFQKLRPPIVNRETRTVEIQDRLELALCGHHAHDAKVGSVMISEGWAPTPLKDPLVEGDLFQIKVPR